MVAVIFVVVVLLVVVVVVVVMAIVCDGNGDDSGGSNAVGDISSDESNFNVKSSRDCNGSGSSKRIITKK